MLQRNAQHLIKIIIFFQESDETSKTSVMDSKPSHTRQVSAVLRDQYRTNQHKHTPTQRASVYVANFQLLVSVSFSKQKQNQSVVKFLQTISSV